MKLAVILLLFFCVVSTFFFCFARSGEVAEQTETKQKVLDFPFSSGKTRLDSTMLTGVGDVVDVIKDQSVAFVRGLPIETFNVSSQSSLDVKFVGESISKASSLGASIDVTISFIFIEGHFKGSYDRSEDGSSNTISLLIQGYLPTRAETLDVRALHTTHDQHLKDLCREAYATRTHVKASATYGAFVELEVRIDVGKENVNSAMSGELGGKLTFAGIGGGVKGGLSKKTNELIKKYGAQIRARGSKEFGEIARMMTVTDSKEMMDQVVKVLEKTKEQAEQNPSLLGYSLVPLESLSLCGDQKLKIAQALDQKVETGAANVLEFCSHSLGHMRGINEDYAPLWKTMPRMQQPLTDVAKGLQKQCDAASDQIYHLLPKLRDPDTNKQATRNLMQIVSRFSPSLDNNKLLLSADLFEKDYRLALDPVLRVFLSSSSSSQKDATTTPTTEETPPAIVTPHQSPHFNDYEYPHVTFNLLCRQNFDSVVRAFEDSGFGAYLTLPSTSSTKEQDATVTPFTPLAPVSDDPHVCNFESVKLFEKFAAHNMKQLADSANGKCEFKFFFVFDPNVSFGTIRVQTDRKSKPEEFEISAAGVFDTVTFDSSTKELYWLTAKAPSSKSTSQIHVRCKNNAHGAYRTLASTVTSVNAKSNRHSVAISTSPSDCLADRIVYTDKSFHRRHQKIGFELTVPQEIIHEGCQGCPHGVSVAASTDKTLVPLFRDSRLTSTHPSDLVGADNGYRALLHGLRNESAYRGYLKERICLVKGFGEVTVTFFHYKPGESTKTKWYSLNNRNVESARRFCESGFDMIDGTRYVGHLPNTVSSLDKDKDGKEVRRHHYTSAERDPDSPNLPSSFTFRGGPLKLDPAPLPENVQWSEGEPNNGYGNKFHIEVYEDGKLNDVGLGDFRFFFRQPCEFSPVTTSEEKIFEKDCEKAKSGDL